LRASNEEQARQHHGSIIRQKRRTPSAQVCIVCKSQRVSNPRNYSARVAQHIRTPRVWVPAPAKPPTAPISPTIDRDSRSSSALPDAGKRIFMRHHKMWVLSSGREQGYRCCRICRGGAMHDPASGVPRIYLPRTPVNKEVLASALVSSRRPCPDATIRRRARVP